MYGWNTSGKRGWHGLPRPIFYDDVIKMEAFSALLAICAGNSLVTGEFPSQRPVTRSFDVFSDLGLNKRLSKQLGRRWFETPSCSLLRHCNVPKVQQQSVCSRVVSDCLCLIILLFVFIRPLFLLTIHSLFAQLLFSRLCTPCPSVHASRPHSFACLPVIAVRSNSSHPGLLMHTWVET